MKGMVKAMNGKELIDKIKDYESNNFMYLSLDEIDAINKGISNKSELIRLSFCLGYMRGKELMPWQPLDEFSDDDSADVRRNDNEAGKELIERNGETMNNIENNENTYMQEKSYNTYGGMQAELEMIITLLTTMTDSMWNEIQGMKDIYNIKHTHRIESQIDSLNFISAKLHDLACDCDALDKKQLNENDN